MKVLHTVESYFPSVGGMQEVVKQLSERLVKLGHEVTVATRSEPTRKFRQLNGVTIESFDLSGNSVRGITGAASEIKRYQEFVCHDDFDVITSFAAQQWATDLVLPILDKIPAKKVFVPTGFPGLAWPEYAQYYERMPSWLRQYDMSVFLSNDYRDINFAREHGVSKVAVIPNGAGEDEFLPISTFNVRRELGVPDDYFLILLVGSHTGKKGHKEAIRIFFKAEIRKAALVIVANRLGKGCSKSCGRLQALDYIRPSRYVGKKRLIVCSLTREQTVAAYQQADLFLFPSNVECSPIVLFECMASNTPFMVTDVGNSAEIIEWSGGGVLMPTHKDDRGYSHVHVAPAAKILESLFLDESSRRHYAETGYQAWLDRFSWEKISVEYESMYLMLVGEDANNVHVMC